jgi:toxin secretion/phage lysis holin
MPRLESDAKEILASLAFEFDTKALLAILAAAFHWTFGAELTPLLVLFLLTAIDGVTGIWKAAARSELSSGGFFRGVVKFVVYLLLMTSAALADKVLPVRFAFTAMTAFLSVTEFISIMENVSLLGFPVPSALVSRLKALQVQRAGAEKTPQG